MLGQCQQLLLLSPSPSTALANAPPRLLVLGCLPAFFFFFNPLPVKDEKLF